MPGVNYWNSANGLNGYGLTLLGSGYRNAFGVFVESKISTGMLCKDADFVRVVKDGDDTFSEVAITTEGYQIRIIKV